MGVVYSMYDALVSIHVPDEKAKAVIDALEREMMDKLATKADLAHLQELLVRDLQMLRTDTERGLEAVRADLGHSLEKLESRILFKVGAMMAASLVLTCTVLGTLLAALR